jgi:hypothetical protein
MMNTPSHEPTPEFARFLEWQVTTAVRRQSRFAEPPRPAFVKHLGIAAMVVVSVLIGAGGVTAAGRVQANQQTKTLLAQQATEVLVAQWQVDAAKQATELAKRQVAAGTATQETMAAAEKDLQLAMLALKKASLGTEEIGASGKPVQDDLAAPLVGTRDFVSERLQIDQENAALAVAAAAARSKLTRTRYEVGLAMETELADAQAQLTRASTEARRVATLIDLRRQFVAGKIKTGDLAHQRLISATSAQLTIAESDLAAAQQRYKLMETRFQVGTTTEVNLLKAKVEMLALEQDIAQLKAKIRQLQEAR